MTISETQLKAAFLRQRQGLPLNLKIDMTKRRIRQWYEMWEGKVYVAYSRGRDSSILAHLIKKQHPDVPLVFVNTGLEYPEVMEFQGVFGPEVVLRPKMKFSEVIEQYGYPILSKETSMAISRYRNTKSDVQRELRMWGGVNPSSGKVQSVGVIPQKYHFLIDAPFKISEKCCAVMKKQPFKEYEKQTGRVPFIGTMAVDSQGRRLEIIRNGCNAFRDKGPQSRPLAFWTEADVKACVRVGVPCCKLYDMGFDTTGCYACGFGIDMEPRPNRFERMKVTHPKLYTYCMEGLGWAKVLDYMGVPYGKN